MLRGPVAGGGLGGLVAEMGFAAGAGELHLALAPLWFRSFRYGPLEWLWRAATRTSFDVPFRQGPAASAG